MLNTFSQMPAGLQLATALLALIVLMMCLKPSPRRGAYRPQGPARSFDECFPEQPLRIQHGIVAERKEEMLPAYSLSAVHHPNPPRVPHYAFTIICDEAGNSETLRLVVAKDQTNIFAEIGRFVEVKSRAHRLDYNHIVHSIAVAV